MPWQIVGIARREAITGLPRGVAVRWVEEARLAAGVWPAQDDRRRMTDDGCDSSSSAREAYLTAIGRTAPQDPRPKPQDPSPKTQDPRPMPQDPSPTPQDPIPDPPIAGVGFGPLDQARVLAAIHRHIGILPVRYGTVLPDDDTVRQFLADCGEELLADLDRVEACGEIGLRIELAPATAPTLVPPPVPLAVSPAAYLAGRAAIYLRDDRLHDEAQRVEQACTGALGGLARHWRRLKPEPLGIVRLSFLVERTRWDAFTRRLEALKSRKLFRCCTLLGPWPPYGFV